MKTIQTLMKSREIRDVDVDQQWRHGQKSPQEFVGMVNGYRWYLDLYVGMESGPGPAVLKAVAQATSRRMGKVVHESIDLDNLVVPDSLYPEMVRRRTEFQWELDTQGDLLPPREMILMQADIPHVLDHPHDVLVIRAGDLLVLKAVQVIDSSGRYLAVCGAGDTSVTLTVTQIASGGDWLEATSDELGNPLVRLTQATVAYCFQNLYRPFLYSARPPKVRLGAKGLAPAKKATSSP